MGRAGSLPYIGGHRGGRLGQVDGRAAAEGQQEITLAHAPLAEIGREPVDVLNLRFMADCSGTDKLDFFRSKKASDLVGDRVGQFRVHTADEPGPAAEHPPPGPHFAASSPAEDDPPGSKEIVGTIRVHDAPL